MKPFVREGLGQHYKTEHIREFQWDKFHTELQLRAPNTLKVTSSTISNIPVIPGEKKFTQLLLNIANVFHSRNQEMSSLHYQIVLILTHGSCKQKVGGTGCDELKFTRIKNVTGRDI